MLWGIFGGKPAASPSYTPVPNPGNRPEEEAQSQDNSARVGPPSSRALRAPSVARAPAPPVPAASNRAASSSRPTLPMPNFGSSGSVPPPASYGALEQGPELVLNSAALSAEGGPRAEDDAPAEPRVDLDRLYVPELPWQLGVTLRLAGSSTVTMAGVAVLVVGVIVVSGPFDLIMAIVGGVGAAVGAATGLGTGLSLTYQQQKARARVLMAGISSLGGQPVELLQAVLREMTDNPAVQNRKRYVLAFGKLQAEEVRLVRDLCDRATRSIKSYASSNEILEPKDSTAIDAWYNECLKKVPDGVTDDANAAIQGHKNLIEALKDALAIASACQSELALGSDKPKSFEASIVKLQDKFSAVQEDTPAYIYLVRIKNKWEMASAKYEIANLRAGLLDAVMNLDVIECARQIQYVDSVLQLSLGSDLRTEWTEYARELSGEAAEREKVEGQLALRAQAHHTRLAVAETERLRAILATLGVVEPAFEAQAVIVSASDHKRANKVAKSVVAWFKENADNVFKVRSEDDVNFLKFIGFEDRFKWSRDIVIRKMILCSLPEQRPADSSAWIGLENRIFETIVAFEPGLGAL